MSATLLIVFSVLFAAAAFCAAVLGAWRIAGGMGVIALTSFLAAQLLDMLACIAHQVEQNRRALERIEDDLAKRGAKN